eukprot:9284290-Ditylum_brightwellii.AAC.1
MGPVCQKYIIDPQLRLLHRSALLGEDVPLMIAQHTTLDWTPYLDVISKQHTIGRDQLRYGCFAAAWTTTQFLYAKRFDAKYEAQWLRKLFRRPGNLLAIDGTNKMLPNF